MRAELIAMRMAIAIIFMWIGMILAVDLVGVINFMLANISHPVAIEINRVMFSFFNAVQLALLMMVLLCAPFTRGIRFEKLLLGLAVTILLVQVAWLFPVLSARADMMLAGVHLEPSYQHHLYSGFEVAKLIILLILGIRLLSQ